MRKKLQFLKCFFTIKNIICMIFPVCIFACLVYIINNNLLQADSIFVLSLLILMAIGTTLAVVNLGKRGFNWIQGSAIIGCTATVFAACGQISKLPHSSELIDFFNRLLISIGITPLENQWSLFVMFALLVLLFWSYLFLVGIFWVGVRDLELEGFRESLNDRIDELSKILEWSIISKQDFSKKETVRFTPLEARIEKIEKGKIKRQYSDLLSCIKKNKRKGRVFLLKGDPGSGKSVALRKLSVTLSKEKNIIPIYVNLKFWKGGWESEKWSSHEKQEKIREFVLDSLEREIKGDYKIQRYLKEQLPQEMTKGSCFFLVDSFDEMPCLLGKGDQERLISDISKELYDFILSHGQGGVVASREYHSPSNEIGADIVLWIQDFDEARIRKMIYKYLPNAGKTVWQELTKNEDMLYLCRNPFYLTMLINYMMESLGAIPEKQIDLFSGFITHSINRLNKTYKLSFDLVFKKATELAIFLDSINEYECLISSLPGDTLEWERAVSVLEEARICRVGGNDNQTITFTHRRFQEFFIVIDMEESHIKYDHIIQNSIVHYTDKRDACILYCEVADRNIAKSIAAYCWNVVQENFSLGDDKWNKEVLVNTLFFMSDAFRRRRIAIEEFSYEFEMKIIQWLDETNDFALQLALVNCMVLFDQKNISNFILSVFEKRNSWFDNAIMTNCRIIRKLNQETENAFYHYIRKMPITEFLKRFQSMHIALSISNAFRAVYRRHTILLVKYFCEVFSLMFIILIGIVKKNVPLDMFNAINNHLPHKTDGVWEGLLSLSRGYVYFDTALITIIMSWYEFIHLILCYLLIMCISIDVSRHLRKTIMKYTINVDLDFVLGCAYTYIGGFFFIPAISDFAELISWDGISVLFILLLIIMGINAYDAIKGRKYLRTINERYYTKIIYYSFFALCLAFAQKFILLSSIAESLLFRIVLYIIFAITLVPYSFELIKSSVVYITSSIKDRNIFSKWDELVNTEYNICIDRVELYRLLMNELNTTRGRIRFTNLLVEKNIKLEGAWPKEFNDVDWNEVVMHNIAVLDWKEKPVGKRL